MRDLVWNARGGLPEQVRLHRWRQSPPASFTIMDWAAYCHDKATECDRMAAETPGVLKMAWRDMASAWREAGAPDEPAEAPLDPVARPAGPSIVPF